MAQTRETVELLDDCEAYLIPEGTPLRLKAGTWVTVTQALGGDVTVNVAGNLAQIFASDAHLLGERYRFQLPERDSGASLEQQVWDRLRSCYDPEIPVNIVDLGLVYNCQICEQDDGVARVAVDMTLTAPACGMGPVLAESVRHRLLGLDAVMEAEVKIVFDPPWGREMMSEAAKLELGML